MNQCSIPECMKPSIARGWCGMHYKRWELRGDPLALAPVAQRKPCSMEGCEARATTRGWCPSHYARWRRYGDPIGVRPEHSVAQCAVVGCSEPALARSWCSTHYARWKRNGDPGADMPVQRKGRSLEERVEKFIDRHGPGGCWRWTGSLAGGGYGYVKFANGKSRGAHRIVYELLVGPVPDGLELDHMCHTRDTTCPGGPTCPHRACVNPAHLEPVTHRNNGLRGRSFAPTNAAKTHCPQGHEYTPENTYINGASGGRVCRTCNNEHQRRYQARKRSMK